jgi:hypothetical protein
MTGCRKPEMQRCVDQQNVVVDEDFCHSNGEQRVLGEKPAASSSYRYYYGGTGSTEAGSTATGGSYVPDANHTYAIGGRERRRLREFGPIFTVLGVVVLFFFAWEGRRKRA